MSKELIEKDLNTVAGGLGRQRTVIVEITIPNFSIDVTLKFYLDGELLSSKTKTVDSLVRNYTLQLSGSGEKILKVKFNDQATKTYLINFDLGTYSEID